MRRLRKVVAVAAAAALTLGLGACAGPNSGSGKVTLTVWDTGLLGKLNKNGSPDMTKSFLHRAAADFEKKNPRVSVKIVEQGGDISSNSAQFKAASIAGNGPDVRIQYTGGSTLSFSKYFVDLSSVLDAKTLANFSGLNTVRTDYAKDGKLLALPYGSGTYFILWWNKKLLAAAGLPVDAAPTSWEDMVAQGRQYKAATGKPAFFVANLEGYVGAWEVAVLAAGRLGEQAFTDQYSGKTKIDSPAMEAAYRTWSDLYASGLTNADAGEVSNGDATAGFVQGKAPFYFSGSWEDAGLLDAMGKDLGWAFVPTGKNAKYRNVALGGPQVAISITSYSKQKETAANFVKYLARPEVQELYVKLGQTEGSSDRRTSTAAIQNPLLKAQTEALKKSVVVYPFDNVMPQSVIDLYYRLNASTFLGKTAPKDAVTQLQSALRAERG